MLPIHSQHEGRLRAQIGRAWSGTAPGMVHGTVHGSRASIKAYRRLLPTANAGRELPCEVCRRGALLCFNVCGSVKAHPAKGVPAVRVGTSLDQQADQLGSACVGSQHQRRPCRHNEQPGLESDVPAAVAGIVGYKGLGWGGLPPNVAGSSVPPHIRCCWPGWHQRQRPAVPPPQRHGLHAPPKRVL